MFKPKIRLIQIYTLLLENTNTFRTFKILSQRYLIIFYTNKIYQLNLSNFQQSNIQNNDKREGSYRRAYLVPTQPTSHL